MSKIISFVIFLMVAVEAATIISLEMAMRRLYVPLDPQTLRRLAELAEIERRHPSQQAAYLIMRALKELKRQEAADGKRP